MVHIEASVNYHVKRNAPQAFEFDVDDIAGKLVSPELVPTQVHVTDLRSAKTQPQFETHGIVFIDHRTDVLDFETGQDWEPAYDRELIELLKQQISAKEVIVFDHTVRIDDQKAIRRPARNVHNDYNLAGAEQRLVDVVGDVKAEAFRRAGFGFVNVWRPIEHIIESSPLGFIQPESMNGSDWMDIGLIYPDRFGQILGVAANADHEWFYKSSMTPNEAIIFNIYDNRGRPHLAHSALDLPGDETAATPRKSIESRTLVRYA